MFVCSRLNYWMPPGDRREHWWIDSVINKVIRSLILGLKQNPPWFCLHMFCLCLSYRTSLSCFNRLHHQKDWRTGGIRIWSGSPHGCTLFDPVRGCMTSELISNSLWLLLADNNYPFSLLVQCCCWLPGWNLSNCTLTVSHFQCLRQAWLLQMEFCYP